MVSPLDIEPFCINKWQHRYSSFVRPWTQLSAAVLTLFIEMGRNTWYHHRCTKHNRLPATCYPLCRGKMERSKTFVCIHRTSSLSAQTEDLSWIIQDQTCWGCWESNTSALQENFSYPIMGWEKNSTWKRIQTENMKMKYTATSNCVKIPSAHNIPSIFN